MGWLHIVWIVLGIGLMLLLNMRFKLNAFLALLIASFFVGFAETTPPQQLLKTIQTGFGDTLGSLAIIVVLGAVIGRLMVDSGAAHQIAGSLIDTFGVRYVKVAITVTGAIFGLAMFYEVAFIILAPLIVSVAVEAKVPFLKLAIPGVAAATTFHSLFPPQPGAVALVDAYHADMGMVYVYAIIVAVPSIAVAGWVLPRFLGNLDRPVPAIVQQREPVPEDERPPFGTSLLVPLIPAIIMIGATIANIWVDEKSGVGQWINFFGSSPVAMLLATFAAFYLFGIRQHRDMDWVSSSFAEGVKGIAMVVLIIGAGGALKQTIIDTGIGDYIGSLMSSVDFNPYVMAWLITVLIRLATGQGVVSAMTAAGIIAPAVMDPTTHLMAGVNPALLVLATAAGANTLTHINDASFWLFKGYFDLSVKDTLKTWGLLELVQSIVGLGVVLLLSLAVG